MISWDFWFSPHHLDETLVSAETVASTDKDLAIADRIPRADRMGNSVQVQVANLGGPSSNC